MNQNNQLKVCSYNSNGSSPNRLEYIKSLFQENDFIFIQEHWLHQENVDKYQYTIDDCSLHGISGMDQNELLNGRPYGGTAILWHTSGSFIVKPINNECKNVCSVIVKSTTCSVLLINLYMPCENSNTTPDNEKFDEILNIVSSICNSNHADYILIGGDLNTDFSRNLSHHTNSVRDFINSEGMFCPTLYMNDFTYESRIDNNQYMIDYFIVTSISIMPVV